MKTDLDGTLIHELFHYAAYAEFGVNSVPIVLGETERYTASNGKTVAGVCEPEFFTAKLSAYQKSVVGWSGSLGQAVMGLPHAFGEIPIPLKKSTLRDWFRMSVVRLQQLSLADQQHICAYRDLWRSFKGAFRIVSKNRRKVERLARLHVAAKPDTLAVSDKAQPMSFADRAKFLEGQLADPINANHPDRARWEAIWEYWRRGLPAPADLQQPQPNQTDERKAK